MKLSIITPIYKEAKHLEKFLLKMEDQTSKNFEIILVVDTNNDNTLEKLENISKKLLKRVKVIFNSKRISRTGAIAAGARQATGEYSLIMSIQNVFDNNLVKNSLEVIKEKKSDVIEFKAKMAAPIKFSGKIRKAYNQPVNPAEVTEVHAFTYPFDFNKFFKTEILIQSTKLKIPVEVNSRYSIDATYLSLIVAKSYSTANKTLVTSKAKISDNFNPLKMIRQWEGLSKVVNDFTSISSSERYVYAQYFAETVFMSAMVKASRNKITNKKFSEKFKKEKETIYSTLFETNKYANTKATEYLALSTHQGITQLNKLHKELG